MSKLSFRQKKVGGPPKDQPWVWKSVEMHKSPAFRAMSTSCYRLMLFLEVENMQSAGADNGLLIATHRQLIEWGINAGRIKAAIDEAANRGLIEVTPGGYQGNGRNWPTRFRLTYYATRRRTPTGAYEWESPTNDWRRYRPTKIKLNALETKAQCLRKQGIQS
jgi:hypothetical protein